MECVRQKAEITYENTLEGVLLRRVNRFTAEAEIDGKPATVHIRNTGRLENLLLPRARITVQRSDNPERKTPYDLISVYRPGFKWVNVDSLAPNMLMKQWLQNGIYDEVKAEYTYGNSRFDFFMRMNDRKILREVKGCTLADDQKSGIGYFPDAPTERGLKHIEELIAAKKEGYTCQLAFVIQMNGIHLVFPNNKIQPAFGAALYRAAKAGVTILEYSCHVEADSIRITGETADAPRRQWLL